MLVLQYESAVLEWFNRAIPALKEAVYAESIDAVLSRDSIVKYPSMVYTRVSSDMELPRPFDVFEDGVCGGVVSHMRCFSWEQEYLAKIVVERQADALRVANELRQCWSHDSYVFVRHTDSDAPTPVGLRFLGLRIDSERSNLDKVGACRVVNVRWKSQLILEAYSDFPAWEGYRLWITPNGVKSEEWLVVEEDFVD